MVVDETINHTSHLGHHLPYSTTLSPIICQLGGRDAESCGKATQVVEKKGYDEINLNIDCPSSRVSGERKFGAILMHDSEAAYSVVSAMQSNVDAIPISVKCRVGIETDDGEIFDTLDHLITFIGRLRECGCRKFIIHARKCVIGGLTPAQNRIVPPLNYPRVYKLCRSFPDCEFVLNGGISGLASARLLCHGSDDEVHGNGCRSTGNENEFELGNSDEKKSDGHSVPCEKCNATNGSCVAPPRIAPPNLTGCMLGRACREHPSMFWDIDRYFYGEPQNPCHNRREALEKYCLYLESSYPRRCCDTDVRKSARLPTPKVEMFTKHGCFICKEFYGDDCCNEESFDIANEEAMEIMFEQQRSKEKITGRAIGRALQPVRGLFFGIYGGKYFKLGCDKLAKDNKIRNCGPGYILRKVMSTMPKALLDEPFIKTECLTESDVPVHVSPSLCHVNCK